MPGKKLPLTGKKPVASEVCPLQAKTTLRNCVRSERARAGRERERIWPRSLRMCPLTSSSEELFRPRSPTPTTHRHTRPPTMVRKVISDVPAGITRPGGSDCPCVCVLHKYGRSAVKLPPEDSGYAGRGWTPFREAESGR